MDRLKKSLIFSFILFVSLTFAFQAKAESYAVRGWQFQSSDEAHINRLLDLAPEYGINHIQLSHSIIMDIDQIVDEPRTRELIDRVSRRADGMGIETFVWSHEFNTKDLTACIDPSNKAGAKFWKKRREVYRRALEAVPSVDGVVLSFGSASPEPWSLMCVCCSRMTNADRVRAIIEQVGAEVTGMGKKLMVRTFIHTPGQLRDVGEAIRSARGVDFIVMPKDVPQDWQPYYPNDPLIGNVGGRPEVIEVDLAGEYWGQGGIPFALVDYLKMRFDFWRTRENIVGAVARIERGSRGVFDNPNSVNAAAFSELLRDPDAAPDKIWEDWVKREYGFDPGDEVSITLISALRRTFDIGRKMYYTLGFWTLEKGSDVPETGRYPRLLDGRSTALYDPDFMPVYNELKNPSEQTLLDIWQEKMEAQFLSDMSVQEIHRIQRALGDKYNDLYAQLRRQQLCTRVWTHVTDAVWRFMFWKKTGDANAAQTLEWDLNQLGYYADLIEKELGADSWPGSPASIRKFITDTEKEFKLSGTRYDFKPPMLFDIRVAENGQNRAVITWKSTAPGGSKVEYGIKLPVYKLSVESGAPPAAEHKVEITGLQPGTRYVFRVVSRLDDGTLLRSGDFDFTAGSD